MVGVWWLRGEFFAEFGAPEAPCWNGDVYVSGISGDSAFADPVAKTNLPAIFQQHGLEIVHSQEAGHSIFHLPCSQFRWRTEVSNPPRLCLHA